jgi:hypothetical protein
MHIRVAVGQDVAVSRWRRTASRGRRCLFPWSPRAHVPAHVGQLVWRDLGVPRPPSAAERDLLAALAAATGDERLLAQVRSSAVVAVCRCGCSSVRMRSDTGPVAQGSSGHLSGSAGWSDYFSVAAEGRGPAGEGVTVTLHVVSGRIEEMEVFAGEGVAVPISGITDLTEPVVR